MHTKMNDKFWDWLDREETRQLDTVNLIASENYASQAVMELSGSVFTNKYAEGYPGARYYNGCEVYDEIENFAIDQLRQLYHCNFANVQPHCGANANLAVMLALLEPGDTILSMSLDHGGHLSHGMSLNISGKLYNIVHYGTDKHGYIDYVQVAQLARKHKPKMIIAGASAYTRTIRWDWFRTVADEVNAYLLADMAHYSGLIAGKAYRSPMQWADVVTSTTHKTLRGPRGGMILWNDDKYTKKINQAVFPGTQGGPLMNQVAAKAQCFYEANQYEFRQYAQQVIDNAVVMAKTFIDRGYKLVSGGTSSHMIILDLSDKKASGHAIANLLEKEHGYVVNKNGIPNDPRPPKQTSGIRIGTAAETTKFGPNGTMVDHETQFAAYANKISDVLDGVE